MQSPTINSWMLNEMDDTTQNDSKEYWLKLRRGLPKHEFRLGMATAQGYIADPKLLGFVAARYKFVAKMLAGRSSVLEVGSCDSFGAPVVSKEVESLLCTDIDEEMLHDAAERLKPFENIRFSYHDFRTGPCPGGLFDAAYNVDVIEHIFPEEEDDFVSNIAASLDMDGVYLMGTPNKAAETHASKNSQLGHVNLKDHVTLRELGEKYFKNVFLFSMNDEMVHTGYYPMAHYLWALCVGRIR